ncbi:DUF1361 domain-containing protein [Amedibacillus sp. YH-ame10]
MRKELRRKEIVFIILFVVYSIFSMYVYNKTKVFIHRAMIWNIMLATLPLFFSSLFLSMAKQKKTVPMIVCFICWLLLFPNVAYLITDFIHITPLTFYEFSSQGSFYVRDIWVWIELLHIGCGVLIGFFAGYRSLYHIQLYVKDKYNSWISWGMVAVVSLLSGFGVFLGRFLRLNSWDVLKPMSLINEVYENIELSFSIPFSFIMAIFIVITYTLFYLCSDHKENYDEKTICE